jgi:hypothetical protein
LPAHFDCYFATRLHATYFIAEAASITTPTPIAFYEIAFIEIYSSSSTAHFTPLSIDAMTPILASRHTSSLAPLRFHGLAASDTSS